MGFEPNVRQQFDHALANRGWEPQQHVCQVAKRIDPVPLAAGRHAEQAMGALIAEGSDRRAQDWGACLKADRSAEMEADRLESTRRLAGPKALSLAHG